MGYLFSSILVISILICLPPSNAQPPDDEKLHGNYESQIPPPNQQPSPDQVKAELAKLFAEADKDGDGKLTIEEVKNWIDSVHQEIIQENVDRQWAYYEPHVQEVHSWNEYKPVEKEVLTWENYRNRTYPEHLLNDPETPEDQRDSWKNMLLRSQRRFHLADRNNDSILVKEEFKDFVHPEESTSDDVKGVLVQEALEDMDKNNDELISLEEYTEHLIAGTPEDQRSDPEWHEVSKPTDCLIIHEKNNITSLLQVQKSHFVTILDKNKDGFLDKDELKHWLSLSADRHIEEAERLVVSADADRDQHLDVNEMVDNFNNFFGLIPPKFWAKYYSDDNLYGTERHDEL